MSRMVLITPRVAVQLAGSPRLPELPAARLSGPDSVAGCGEKTPYIPPSPPSEEAGAGGAGAKGGEDSLSVLEVMAVYGGQWGWLGETGLLLAKWAEREAQDC